MTCATFSSFHFFFHLCATFNVRHLFQNIFFCFFQLETFKTYKTERHKFSVITAQKMKFFIKDFFNKCDQINRNLHSLCSVLYILSYLVLLGYSHKEPLFTTIQKPPFRNAQVLYQRYMKGNWYNKLGELSSNLHYIDSL